MVGGGEDQRTGGCVATADRDYALDRAIEHTERAGWGQQPIALVPRRDERVRVGGAQMRWRLCRRRGHGPPIGEHHVVERETRRPAGPLQARFRRTFVGPAEAQPAECDHARRQVHERGQVVRLEQRDPPEAESLRAGGQPQVFDGGRATPHVGVGERRAPEHAGRGRAPVTTDDDADRRLAQTLQLQILQPPSRVGLELRGLPQPFAIGQQPRPGTNVRIADDDEAPRLAVADARRDMGSAQHPAQHVVRDRVGSEPADVAARFDDRVGGRSFVGGKGPPARIGRTL
jgi:hypothetical protein